MKIIWNGHACFTVETEQGTVVLDPYADGYVPGLGKLRLQADAVLCSHGHADHNAVETVQLTGQTCGVKVETLATFHDEVKGAKRGPNTVHILEAEGMRLAHMGDIGCELTDAELEKLRGVDVLLIPVGGFFTIGPEEAAEMIRLIGPRVAVPMHYRKGGVGYDKIAPLDDFLKLVQNPVRYPTNELIVTGETPQQIAVPALPMV